jgi:hypothetical protein
MLMIKQNDRKIRASYNAATPKQFGDLHQRMQYLIHCAFKANRGSLTTTPGRPSSTWRPRSLTTRRPNHPTGSVDRGWAEEAGRAEAQPVR